MAGRRATTGTQHALRAPQRGNSRDWGQNGTTEPCGATETPLANAWRFWFAARLGPARKRQRTVNGVRLTVRVRSHELPPGPNGSRGNPIAHGKWVAEWRKAAKEIVSRTVGEGMEPMARALIHIDVYRRALGTADPDNDLARIKPLIDGCRDAGLLRKDTYDAVTFGRIAEHRIGSWGMGIMLTVEEI